LVEAFEEAFPGITVDHLAESSASVWIERVRQERQAQTYSFDLAFVLASKALAEGAPAGFWAPSKPLLFRPDVLDDRVWRDSTQDRFLDADGNLCFGWEYQVFHAYAINTQLVQQGEIRMVDDLLDPKWKGRILSFDPRGGSGLIFAASVAKSRGTDLLKRLLVDQQPT